MSILIRNIEIPKNCMGCKLYRGNIPEFNYTDSRVYRSFNGCPIKLEEAIEDIRKLPSWCPLVEIPPHGRLIDADALTEVLLQHLDALDGLDSIDMAQRDGLSWAIGDVDEAPTIIDSEGEEK